MERRGLVTKVKDLPRKNMVRVTMTDLGRHRYEASLRSRGVREIVGTLPDEELSALESALSTLREAALDWANVARVLSRPEHAECRLVRTGHLSRSSSRRSVGYSARHAY